MLNKLNKKQNLFSLLILAALAVLPLLGLAHPGLPITHDGQDHVARIANFYQNLLDGNLIPRWAANLNWGYGHPVIEFLYPLPSYLASVFHFAGLSLVDSAKIVYGLGMVLSLLSMYLWLKQFLGKEAALLGAFLYTYAPYRLVDLYVRGDIGENLAFAFAPLVLYFIYKFYKQPSLIFPLLGALSLGLLITAHNAISLILMPFILFYGLFLFYFSKNRRTFLVHFCLTIVLGFGLAAFFWIPGLLEAKYTLRDIVTKGQYITRFVNFGQIIYGPWNYGQTGQFTVQLGIVQWLGLILSPFLTFLFWKKKDKNYLLMLVLILLTLVAIFLMLPVSNFLWSKSMLLQNFQFPWRFLAITVFSTAIISALALNVFPKKFQWIIVVILIVGVLLVQKDYLQAKGYAYKPNSFYSGVYAGTTDTGESSPIWSVRAMEHTPKAHLEMIDGKASIQETKRTSTNHVYAVSVAKKTLFEENTLYFPGWQIKANNVPVSIEFQDMQYRGTMLFFLDKGNYTVNVSYSETKLRLICDIISLVSLIALIGLFGFMFVKTRFS